MSRAPYIIGIDLATNSGICEGHADETPIFYSQTFVQKGDEHEDSFARALRWIAGRLQVSKPDGIFIEAPRNPGFGGTSADTTLRLIGLWATVSAAILVKGGIRYQRVHVQDAREVFIGERNAPGEEAKQRVLEMCAQLGWAPKNDNEGDAAAVWNMGVRRTCREFAVPIPTEMCLKVANIVTKRLAQKREDRFARRRKRAA